jgi:ribosomal protein S18 acetylase RimI-like enzyme
MTIRPATPNDAAGIAKVHIDSWRTSYAGIVPDDFLASMEYKERTSRWQSILTTYADRNYTCVAEVDGEIIGFASGGIQRDIGFPDYTGELYAIYLLQSVQGNGYGRQLFEVLVKDLIEHGHQSMLLWVLRDNRPARGFYEKMGGEYVSEKTFELGGKELVEVSYGWKDIRSLIGENE